MSQELIDALVAIATVTIPIVLAYLLPPLRQYLQAKLAAVQHEELRKHITGLVMSAEQIFKDASQNPAKLDYVTDQAWPYVQSLGLTLTREQVRALIEAAVHAMSVQEAATITLPPPAVGSTGTTSTQATITSTNTAAEDAPATAVKTWEHRETPV